MNIFKRLFVFIFILVTPFVVLSCKKEKSEEEPAPSIQYLSAVDYQGGNIDGKLKNSMEIAIGEKCYAVIDYSISRNSLTDGLDSCSVLIDVASDKCKGVKIEVEEFPTSDYSIEDNKIKAKIKLPSDKEKDKYFRFIISVIAEGSGEIGISTWKELEVDASYYTKVTTSTVEVNEYISVESKLEFELAADGNSYVVTGLGGEKGDKIPVPSWHEGKAVLGIANNVFNSVVHVKELYISEGIEKIGSYAFKGCVGLNNIVIPSSVNDIGEGAFADCPDMEIFCDADEKPSGWDDNWAPDGKPVTWGFNKIEFGLNRNGMSYSLLASYTDSEHVSVPSLYKGLPVTKIEENAFYSCKNLKSVKISDSITEIGGGAFTDCIGLTDITVPNSVTRLGEKAFYNCTGISKAMLGSGITSIDYYAFYGCEGLENIEFSENSKLTSIGEHAFYGCEGLENIEFSENSKLTSIGEHAFADCTKLRGIDIPNSVIWIDHYAFSHCESLTSVTIGNSVTSIGDYAFNNCDSLASVTIENGVTSIGDSAFYSCDTLTSVKIGDSVEMIGDSAFSNCDSLASVTIGNGVTSIGDTAFCNCDSLMNITIGESVKEIGVGAFYDCDSLMNITIGESVKAIGDGAFCDCDRLASVTISKSVSFILAEAFYDCPKLTDIKYRGTKTEWNAIFKGSFWDYRTGNYKITYNYTDE